MKTSNAKSLTAFDERPLLYSRAQAAKLLGRISVASVIRLEQDGLLTPIKLNPNRPTSSTFYRASQVRRLAKGQEAGNAQAT
jgi:hypothetical protein